MYYSFNCPACNKHKISCHCRHSKGTSEANQSVSNDLSVEEEQDVIYTSYCIYAMPEMEHLNTIGFKFIIAECIN